MTDRERWDLFASSDVAFEHEPEREDAHWLGAALLALVVLGLYAVTVLW